MIKKTVWVVDDDPIYQIIVNKIIQKSEMFSSVSSFKNGKEAIEALHHSLNNTENIPDIILLDINMPIMDGWEFMDEMGMITTKITQQISVYIVSSSISAEDKNKSATFSDILGYLSKPVAIDDLLEIASK